MPITVPADAKTIAINPTTFDNFVDSSRQSVTQIVRIFVVPLSLWAYDRHVRFHKRITE